MTIIELPSPNSDDREGQAVDILLLHYTGMRTAQDALDRLRDPAAKVSAHYVIGEDGAIYRLVAEAKRAWHAGISCWDGARDINRRSIGIEIVNPGHEFGYRPFPPLQMRSVRDLAREILTRHRIAPHRVLGHSDVAPLRKEDPGELFDWAGLAAAGIGLWPVPKPALWEDAEFLAALQTYGYDLDGPPGTEPVRARQAAIVAFERHFRPSRMTGRPDAESKAILNGLIDLAGLKA
jgi:N-acetylmuramoyl-L-alanine amidase